MARLPGRKRRLRGTGSVSLRPDGRWEGRWRAPADGSGPRPWIRAFANSESACDAALAAEIRAAKSGTASGDSRQTVSAYLDAWLASHVAGLKPATRRNYDLHVRHMRPLIGSFLLGALRRRHIQAMVDAIAVRSGARTAGSVHATLRSALNYTDDGVLEINPALRVHLPSYRRPVPAPWQLDEARLFLDAIEGTEDEAMWLIAAYMGPRPYEVLGISWGDVDLEAGTLELQHGIQWPTGADPYLDSIKSAAGHRTIGLAPRVVAALRRHKARQEARRDASLPRWVESDLVFVETGGRDRLFPGRPSRPDTMSHRFQDLIKRHGLRQVRLYDLRRLASAIIISTQGLEAAQKTLGQSSIRLAAETYGYQLDDTARRVAASVETVLGSGRLTADSPADSPARASDSVLRRNEHARTTPK